MVIRYQTREAINDIKETIKAQLPSQNPADYLVMATNALINKGKKPQDVKMMLMAKTLPQETAIVVIEKAQGICEKWLAGLSADEKIKHEEKIKSFNAPMMTLFRGAAVHPSIYKFSKSGHSLSSYWGSLMGDVSFRQLKTSKETLFLLAASTSASKPVKASEHADISESSFEELGGSDFAPFIRTITVRGDTTDILPYLPTDITTPFEIKRIGEWKSVHDSGYITNAEITGVANSAFDIGFVATDYATNQDMYKTQPHLNIRLSAFAFVIEDWQKENDLVDRLGNPIGLLPDNEDGRLSGYDFTGKVLEEKSATIYNESYGSVLTLKIITAGNPSNDFVLDVFVNSGNLKATNSTMNMIVRGKLWMQGEIAGNS